MSSTQPSSPSSMFAPWVIVLVAGSCIVTVTLGIRQVFGLFMVPISNELGTGLQTFSLAIAAQNLLWGASSPFFGALADKIGAWKVAALGALIYSAGLLFTALMVTETGIFLGQILIGIGMGSAGISIALGAVARAVPPEKRSLAFGMVTSFGSFGQFALLPITQLLIGGYGWQILQEPGQADMVTEIWSERSWAEHLRHHERVSVTDKELQDRIAALLSDGAKPVVTHLMPAIL